VRSLAPAGRPAAWAELPDPFRLIADTAAVADAEWRKIRRDPLELLSRATQPLLWLLVFGQVLARIRAIPTGSVPYMDFLAPGVLAQSALFSAIFYGIAVIWERDLGIVQKLLVSPATRTSLVLGKAATGGARALVQAMIIYVVAGFVGIHLKLDPASLLGVGATMILGSALFATFSLIIACVVRTRERFMGIGQLLTMPLFFASSAVYPVALMPGWLQFLAAINPLTYMVDAMRGLMIVGGTSVHPLLLDLGVLAGGLAVMVWIAARLYPRLA
jgi:ABC-2 type transport system permease protein